MQMKHLLFLMLFPIGIIGINCSNAPIALGPVSSSAELAGFIDDGIFEYGDTLYLVNFKIPAMPAREEMLGEGVYYGTSITLPSGEKVMHHYYFPPMCGDFVLIGEDGQAGGQYSDSEACN